MKHFHGVKLIPRQSVQMKNNKTRERVCVCVCVSFFLPLSSCLPDDFTLFPFPQSNHALVIHFAHVAVLFDKLLILER